MELYIKVENNTPVDHPILGDNLRMFYPDLSEDNIPEGYAKFVRKPVPEIGRFEKLDGSEYVWENGVLTDNWVLRPMTSTELAEFTETVRSASSFPSWTFDEANVMWVPPVPRPSDGQGYRWNEESQTWITFQAARELALAKLAASNTTSNP